MGSPPGSGAGVRLDGRIGEDNPQPESGPGPAVFSGLELEWPLEVPPGRRNQSSPTTPQGTSRVYEPQQLDRRPRLNNAATVAEVMERLYPRELREAGIGGTVIVEFTIERDGIVNPASVSVVESPRDELSQVTLQALERFRFSPGQIDGVDVRVRIGMPIHWRSSAPATPPARGIGADRAAPLWVVPAEIFHGPPGHIVLALPGVRAGGTAVETTLASADELGALSRAPRLSNEAEVRQDMSQLYPAELQAAGVGGTVIAQFVIGADGRTEPGSITIIHSANPAFNDATRTVVQRMRFIPAQFQARDAPVMTQMAITWEP
jgi:TonB family protein